MTKKTETSQTSPSQMLTEIDAKIAGLLAQDKTLLARQLEYEGSHIRPEPPKPGPDARDIAATLLNGHATVAETEPTDGRKFYDLLVERKGIELAVAALGNKSNQARILALAEVMEATGADWRALQRQRVECVLALHRLNKEAAAFRDQIWKIAGRDPGLVADVRGNYFGTALAGDFYQFVQNCISNGIISRREVDVLSSGAAK